MCKIQIFDILKKYSKENISELKDAIRVIENDTFGKYYNNLTRYNQEMQLFKFFFTSL